MTFKSVFKGYIFAEILPNGASLLLTPLLGSSQLTLDAEQPQAGDQEGAVEPGAAVQPPQVGEKSKEAASSEAISSK